MCYFVGAYLANGFDQKIESKYLFLILASCVVILFIWGKYDSYTAYEYCNPIVILESAVIFLLFLKLDVRNEKVEKIITTVSGCSFTVFLIHGYFITHIAIERYVNQKPVFMVLHILACITGIFCIGFIVDCLYKKLSDPLDSKLRSWGTYYLE